MYKYVATFILGAVTGAGGILLWLRKDYNKKIEEEVALREKKSKELEKENKELKKDLEAEKNKADEKVYNELRERLGYSGDAAEVMTRKPVRTHSTASQGPSTSDIPRSEKIYGISDEDFLLTNKDFDKISLFYYTEDDVLALENGQVIEDVPYILGDKWKDEIGKHDPDAAFIRNENTGADYEINIEQMRYSDEYGDIQEE